MTRQPITRVLRRANSLAKRRHKVTIYVPVANNVYYDGRVFRATTLPDLRRKWHEQLVQSLYGKLFRNVPTYWEKDDHDHRYNDCDRAGDREPSSELGIATFREQVPVVDPSDPEAKTYRTFRVNRDLQIWLVEGRDYRSPNRMPDGSDKTLWGAEQIAWLAGAGSCANHRSYLRAHAACEERAAQPPPVAEGEDA